jgi:hypothetical protein
LCNYVLENSSKKGDCGYCGGEDVDMIESGALYDLFRNLLQVYVPSNDPHGDCLIDLIQGDYKVFDEAFYDSCEADRLLEDIMASGWDDDSGEPQIGARDLYYPGSSQWLHTTMVERWEEFSDKVKLDSGHQPEFPELFDEEIGSMEVVLRKGTPLHRARLGFASSEDGVTRPYRGSEIGAPPRGKAKPARANTKGEVVLYCTDQEGTAIAEVRPWRGLLVSVAEMRSVRDLSIVDLSEKPPPSNPFTDGTPAYERELEELLMVFGEELGRPLRRADDADDYLPCQKLVGRIRQSGFYDGIRYPSAMAPRGTNVVLFDPAAVEIGQSRLVEVTKVGIIYRSPESA